MVDYFLDSNDVCVTMYIFRFFVQLCNIIIIVCTTYIYFLITFYIFTFLPLFNYFLCFKVVYSAHIVYL